ncbi:MAG: hypothetical protein NC210_04275 [[Clostridium] fimetarium]|nr:hypothetical protein [Alistipes timonensis]MCM1405619.1 hypothetical protein [[Clostridium] fimetarium]
MNKLELPITTETFRTGSAPHAKRAALKSISRWWFAAIPLAAMAVYGVAADIRWFITAAAILLLVIPVLILFGYVGAMADRDAIDAQFPRRVRFDTDGSITIWRLSLPTDEGAETNLPEPSPCRVAPSEIDSLAIDGGFVEVVFGSGKRLLLVPVDALPDDGCAAILAGAFGKPEVNS